MARSKPGKIAAYLRVSTTGQNLDGQRAAVQAWLDGQGLLATWYEDQSTGDNLDRPEFDRLQADIFNGRISTVLVFKLDRISRNLRDGVNVLTSWLDQGVRIVSTTQQLDFNGTTGKLIASVLFAVAEMEQESRRERQAVGIAAAKAKGVYANHGRKPGIITVDIARIKELRKTLSIAETARAMGVSPRTICKYQNGESK